MSVDSVRGERHSFKAGEKATAALLVIAAALLLQNQLILAVETVCPPVLAFYLSQKCRVLRFDRQQLEVAVMPSRQSFGR